MMKVLPIAAVAASVSVGAGLARKNEWLPPWLLSSIKHPYAAQVFGIVVGYLLDRVGLRWMFALNFAACAACYALLANATSIELLFASKVPALFQAGFLCAQTAAAS